MGEERGARARQVCGVLPRDAGADVRRLAVDVLTPHDAGYDEARRVYNGRVDRRPSLIALCASEADVAATLRLARDAGLPLAIRGGGHSAAGLGVCEGGVVADLRRMNAISVDVARRVARVAAGATWGDVDAATASCGLATTGCRISSVGVGGSTLGGGYGWLMRRFGLAIDNLVAVELVLADGTVTRTDATHRQDLFWAVRGGGGNFGIATAFEFRLHAIPDAVIGGMLFYETRYAADVLETYRAVMSRASDDLCAQCNVLIAPPVPFVPESLRGRPIVAIPVCHLAPDCADRDLEPLLRLQPAVARIRPMPYTKLQRLFDAAGVFGRCTFGRSGHLHALSDEVLDVVLRHALDITSPFSIVMLSPLGGAVARIDDYATAFGHRQTAFDCAIDAVWVDPSESALHTGWVNRFWAAMRPLTDGVYVNELGDEGADRVREAYRPASYDRLAAIKRSVDPDNCFRNNHNIEPTAHQEIRRC